GVARSIEAGDVDPANLDAARLTWSSLPEIRLREFDAADLPYRDHSFDVVLLFESVYYLRAPDAFFREAARVLRSGGEFLLATVNCQWRRFNPSPFSIQYLSATQLKEGLEQAGFDVEIRAGFRENASAKAELVAIVRRIAVALNLIPGTMTGKALLKRL